jgi:hypothetical protein
VIACYEYYSSAALGMTQNSAYYIGMTLFPSPFVLLYLPGVDDIPNEIESVAGIVFEKVVELFRFAVFGT